jgi:integrase
MTNASGHLPHFDQKTLAAMKADGEVRTLWDPQTPGLCFRMSASGSKSYYLVYRMGGRGTNSKWLKLGSFQSIPLVRVREVARAYKAQVDTGEDPAKAIAAKAGAGATVADVVERFMKEYAPQKLKPKSIADYTMTIGKHIIPKLGRIPIKDLDRATVSTWHSRGSDKNGAGAVAANRALAILSSICTRAEIWGLRQEGANPCRHVQRNPEVPRARDVQAEELEAIGRVLSQMETEGASSPWTLAAIKVIALCAGRVSEVLSLRWDGDLHLEDGYALLREHKTSKTAGAKRLELPPDPVEIIMALPRTVEGNMVFCGRGPDSALSRCSVANAWHRVCTLAGVEDLHLHDFRSYAASEGLEQGIDARVTAKLLGHSSSRTTEKHYLNVRKRKTAEAAAAIAGPVAKAFGLKKTPKPERG